jgi:hypothetical protein
MDPSEFDRSWRQTGHLRKGAEPGTVEGELVDKAGFTLILTGTLTAPEVYTLTAVNGPVPPEYWIEAIDGERPG